MFTVAIRRARRLAVLSQFQVDTELMMKDIRIDEVSLLFRNEAELDKFGEWASAMKLEHFNSVTDTCVAITGSSMGETYEVRLEFFRFPGTDWRIEAMCILSGNAPLHRIHIERYGSGTPIHASFKCENLNEYKLTKERLGDYGPGMIPIVEYQNAYGRYCYFGGSELDRYYLKPRVNMRDPVPASP